MNPNLNVSALGQLIADGAVHLLVGSDPTTQGARAQVLMDVAGAFIAANSGDLVTSSADFATITAGIKDPALKDMALQGVTVVAGYVAGIRNLTGATILGTSVTALLNGIWTQVSAVAQVYVKQAQAAAPAVKAA